eukprot:15445995-Alexandrium_andersonii.AAC.1
MLVDIALGVSRRARPRLHRHLDQEQDHGRWRTPRSHRRSLKAGPCPHVSVGISRPRTRAAASPTQ